MTPYIQIKYTVDTILGNIAPSLVPSSACQRRAFFYVAQRHPPLAIISFQVILDLLSQVPERRLESAAYQGKREEGPTPVPPSDIDLTVTLFVPAQKPGQNFLLPTTQT